MQLSGENAVREPDLEAHGIIRSIVTKELY